MRRLIAFPCQGDTLLGTLDEGTGATGVLIVSGGNEIRMGPHRGMAMLAASLAKRGLPVFRFDRRGIGDSEGRNGGWASSGPDLAAAATAFRSAQPQMTRIIALGNCDAAAALAMFGRDAGIDRVVLTNPWLGDEIDDLPPAAAIKARYAARLRQRSEWARLFRGGVDLRKLAGGLHKIVRPDRRPPLGAPTVEAIHAWGDAASIVLAEEDATAIAFAAAAKDHPLRLETIATASHSFAGQAGALEAAILRAAA